MKAIETTATINEKGELNLDNTLKINKPQRVRIIVLMSEEEDLDYYDTPLNIIQEGIEEGLHQAFTAQTIPLEKMWEGIDVE
ncbi:type II toxin-antitoxin system RelN family antitoxin [Geminocystis herdmanii]|uniref:type II toxin-antitoxin system RelN family antitoxin n=1 Tax=Geminocystis herdmanii TaxID=669359 RepID=UPI00034684DA|nr:hypothetical protein [Geminocystis herdmanii]